MAATRDLFEGTVLAMATIAERVGVSDVTVRAWGLAGGWVRPPGAPSRHTRARRTGWMAERRRLAAERAIRDAEAGRAPLTRRVRSEHHRADTVEAVRRLFVGTELGYAAIARRVGVSPSSVRHWALRRGWERPAGVLTGAPTLAQAKPGRRRRMAFARAERVAERYLATLRAAPVPDEAALSWAESLRAEAAARAKRGGGRPRQAGPAKRAEPAASAGAV